jgi:hypothetical protein
MPLNEPYYHARRWIARPCSTSKYYRLRRIMRSRSFSDAQEPFILGKFLALLLDALAWMAIR